MDRNATLRFGEHDSGGIEREAIAQTAPEIGHIAFNEMLHQVRQATIDMVAKTLALITFFLLF